MTWLTRCENLVIKPFFNRCQEKVDVTLLDLKSLAKALSKHSKKLKALLIGLFKCIMVKMSCKVEVLQKPLVFWDTKLRKVKYFKELGSFL